LLRLLEALHKLDRLPCVAQGKETNGNALSVALGLFTARPANAMDIVLDSILQIK
jgi:hypothetical protein